MRTSIDGVETFWAPCEGPLRCVLSFRNGMADETYLTAGISHVVEHLALFGLEDASRHNNGYVDATTTVFHTQGSADEVATFLTRLTAQLSHLPLQRLEQERSVLAAEAAMRGRSIVGTVSPWRFGANGYGLLGGPRFGEQFVTAEDVSQWATARFTRENAVLWLSGPPPAPLHLELPSGARYEAPTPAPLLPDGQFHIHGPVGGVAMSSLVSRSTSATLVTEALQELLRKHLRADLGISYSPEVSYERWTPDFAHVVALADAAPQRLNDLPTAFLATFQELWSTPAEQVERLVAERRRQGQSQREAHPNEWLLSDLASRATQSLFGREPLSLEEILDDSLNVTHETFMTAVGDLSASPLLILATEDEPEGYGIHPPTSLAAPVMGKRRIGLSRSTQGRVLVTSSDGVTLDSPGDPWTVRYDRLVAALHYPDGAIALVADDATHLHIEPTVWEANRNLTKEILSRVPAHLVRTMPARPAEQIPKATGKPLIRFISDRDSGFNVPPLVMLTVVWALAVIMVAFTIPSLFAGDPAGFMIAVLLCAPMIALTHHQARKERSRQGT